MSNIPPRQYGDDELVINYHDACIYGRDLKLLESADAWLNDACIHYYLTRLQQEHSDQLFMDPSVISFLMHQCDDDEELRDLSEGYKNFQRIHRIFVPINDNMASSHWTTPGLGVHWSLLVVLIQNNIPSYHHFDSVPGANSQASHAVARKWQQLMQVAMTGRKDLGKARVCECQTPPQKNSYDCGVHVLATARALSSSSSVVDLTAIVEEQLGKDLRKDPDYCGNLRQFIANDIRRMAAEK